MAAPVVDFGPVVATVLPMLILGAGAGFLVNAITPKRRRRRQPEDPLIVSVIGSMIGGVVSLIQHFSRRAGHSPGHDLSTSRSSVSGMEVMQEVATPPPGPSWSLEYLRKLEWKRLEILTTEFLKAIGFDAKMTRAGADGGVDVMLYHSDNPTPVGVAQCKAWNTYTVGIKPVRELYGVMAAEHVQYGLFVTTSTFTEEARAFAHGKELELVDGPKLIEFITRLRPERQAALLGTVFEDDYTTPTCPRCDVKMVLRTAQKGRDPGSQFWGCPNYPRCRQTFRMASDKEEGGG